MESSPQAKPKPDIQQEKMFTASITDKGPVPWMCKLQIHALRIKPIRESRRKRAEDPQQGVSSQRENKGVSETGEDAQPYLPKIRKQQIHTTLRYHFHLWDRPLPLSPPRTKKAFPSLMPRGVVGEAGERGAAGERLPCSSGHRPWSPEIPDAVAVRVASTATALHHREGTRAPDRPPQSAVHGGWAPFAGPSVRASRFEQIPRKWITLRKRRC